MATVIKELPPVTPKEIAPLVRRSARWVARKCGKGEIPTLEPHTPPYRIPGNYLFKLGVAVEVTQ